jgi:hypothetical protein
MCIKLHYVYFILNDVQLTYQNQLVPIQIHKYPSKKMEAKIRGIQYVVPLHKHVVSNLSSQ